VESQQLSICVPEIIGSSHQRLAALAITAVHHSLLQEIHLFFMY